MKTSDFHYELPEQAISTQPAQPRDAARLLISRDSRERVDSVVSELPSFLNSGDVVVVNNTKVLPARILIERDSGGHGEVFLLHRIDENVWSALVKPSKKISVNEKVNAPGYNANYSIEVGDDLGEGHRVIRFLDANETDVLRHAGRTPLPPYLGDIDIPLERYQTMFARDDQSVAAPTAGLHFTDDVVNSLQAKGAEVCEVTLHVGVGTFRPIMTDNIEDHVMHEERYCVDDSVWKKVLETKSRGGRIIAVGTTSLRTLESVALSGNLSGVTDLYCHGDFDFKIVDYLLTNFHQPESSLLVLLDAFMGERWRELYAHALSSNYRFLSFGDAMLVGPKGKP